MRNSPILKFYADCMTVCSLYGRYCYKCSVAYNKKLMAEAKAKADQIKMDKFQCVCDDEDDATECDYCFEMMMAQDRLKNHK